MTGANLLQHRTIDLALACLLAESRSQTLYMHVGRVTVVYCALHYMWVAVCLQKDEWGIPLQAERPAAAELYVSLQQITCMQHSPQLAVAKSLICYVTPSWIPFFTSS